jgi:hypothetical protein
MAQVPARPPPPPTAQTHSPMPPIAIQIQNIDPCHFIGQHLSQGKIRSHLFNVLNIYISQVQTRNLTTRKDELFAKKTA